ncbi:MAG: AmmeMemoRadiSam system radical SAM enzyme [Lachnospiraceae bacterium]|nr:AmmeMemoRadiSam system radical SAM enzyme [Lachnospiraceae bacterium]MDD4525478.1 AmmeMemoRadiSam system radical SAM enzyme [Lachnospiraceae bacterium]
MSEEKVTCNVCHAHCALSEGQTGRCMARWNNGGKIKAKNYGVITSLALDPIEKKPLARFFPGTRILSVGSYGCNLQCPFCQNYEISRSDGEAIHIQSETMSPEELCSLAAELKNNGRGNIGVAFTYNEPLVGWEFVRDTAKLVHAAGMKNVLVSNGNASQEILAEILPYIDAMNIDLKSFDGNCYKDYLKGDLDMVKAFISTASRAEHCDLEITSLIVPGHNDSPEEMRDLSSWIAALDDGRGIEIPLHITRYFPRYRESAPATDIALIHRLAAIAKENLHHVYIGNC